jgi:sulfate adenylyltransferase
LADNLVAPHGGRLAEGLVDDRRREQLRRESRAWPSWTLTTRQICDLELLLNGGFSPLEGFLGRADYERVCRDMRLADGTLWPIPVVLDLPRDFAASLSSGPLALRDEEGLMLAVLHVTELWQPDLEEEARLVLGTDDPAHPGVAFLRAGSGHVYAAGPVEGLQLPLHWDFRALRQTPRELRDAFHRNGWTEVVAFQTRNPIHRAHFEVTLRAAAEAGAHLLLHPVVGMTKAGDLDHYTRVRCYQAVLPRYPQNSAKLSLLPLAMRMAGPREALWHAIIRKNHGCSHFIVGRDHAGPGPDSAGRPFYDPYAAQRLLRRHEAELGIASVPLRNLVYDDDDDAFVADDEVPEGHRVLELSGTDLRRRLADGGEIPAWFTFPDVAEELRRRHPPRHRQGLTLLLTGLSGAGKSTIANILVSRFLELGQRPVTLLDGDLVRRHLSSELGFSKEDRDTNIRRIGFVASEITKNGGIAICAPIAPFDSVRKDVRTMVSAVGGFALVFVDAPLEVCEARDRKGLYARARAGQIAAFTGISDPYEAPEDADVVLRTAELQPEEAARQVMLHLEREGYVRG